MIIFGVSVFYIFGLIGTGQFHCPHCGGDREYEHRTARRFFTLFFMPVIPLDKVGEVVRCKTCRTRFDPIVLRRPTTAQLASALPAGMRAAAAIVLRAGGANEAAIRVAVDAVHEAGEPDYDATQLRPTHTSPPSSRSSRCAIWRPTSPRTPASASSPTRCGSAWPTARSASRSARPSAGSPASSA